MAHSTRGGIQNQQPSVPSYVFDLKLMESQDSSTIIHDVIEDLVFRGAEILYMKYIKSQICPYASRTLARELVMNASWASFPLDCGPVTADPDDDLVLPPIDEWAGGVLPVRGTDSSGLRCSVTPQREVRKTATTSHRARSNLDPSSATTPSGKLTPTLSSRTISSVMQRTSARNRGDSQNKPKPKPQLTEAQIITKKFDEARKKMNVMMKAVTVDSDFSVIQIQEPKGLPPALIVPKVATKKPASTGKTQKQNNATIPRITRPVVQKNDTKRKRRPQSKLIEPDVPVFDEEVAEISFSDRFVCAPGVTFKDGSTVKSRPQQTNTAQLTRAQYEQYLEEMKRGSDEHAD